jgi:hypothetical protein
LDRFRPRSSRQRTRQTLVPSLRATCSTLMLGPVRPFAAQSGSYPPAPAGGRACAEAVGARDRICGHQRLNSSSGTRSRARTRKASSSPFSIAR